jgi:tetratricopeptide (TPR) repeat protein
VSNLGVAHRQTNKLDLAEKEFLKAIELKPDQGEYHFNLGTVYRRQQKVKEAIAEYQTAIRLAPELAEAHYDLGVLYGQEKKNLEAVAEWNRYLQLTAGQNPKEADIVRQHIKELGGTPSK